MAPEMLQRGQHNRMVDFYQVGALLYELVTGLPPNYSREKRQMYENIMTVEPRYAPSLSEEIVDLLKRLLVKEPESRLGFKGGFSDVK
mmetsp:Transcript_38622/g.36976  ORF Transcript_38622/g.36976 Transcript_38622/m.36976 type:complete len:88 (-) Transcript_38622:45-308(-)